MRVARSDAQTASSHRPWIERRRISCSLEPAARTSDHRARLFGAAIGAGEIAWPQAGAWGSVATSELRKRRRRSRRQDEGERVDRGRREADSNGHTGGKSPAFRRERAKSRETRTLRWREPDYSASHGPLISTFPSSVNRRRRSFRSSSTMVSKVRWR
jgi:hypothetical protein